MSDDPGAFDRCHRQTDPRVGKLRAVDSTRVIRLSVPRHPVGRRDLVEAVRSRVVHTASGGACLCGGLIEAKWPGTISPRVRPLELRGVACSGCTRTYTVRITYDDGASP